MRVIKASIERTAEENKALRDNVTSIIDRVRSDGDEALIWYNNEFDGNGRRVLRVSREEIKEAYSMVTEKEVAEMKEAAANIEAFAKAQRGTILDLENVSPFEGASLGHRVIPINAAGCYVPGGSYPLYSSALMLIIPAKIAGCKRVVAISPAVRGSEKIHEKTLVAMDIAGADEIYAVGGAHGVAALSYGTEQIKPVDIIVGPGNQYVSEAKRQCYGQVGIDFIAGPSEVLVIADDTASPKIIAADLLAQAEHDLLAKGILLTNSERIAEETLKEVYKQLETLETREIARKSWEDYGEIIVLDTIDEAIKVSNEYAPEHLEIALADNDSVIEQLDNYGSLFISEETGEVFGDYASGTNHTLPTLKAARYTGGVYVGTFLKVCTHQRMTKDGMNKIAPLVASLAKGEGLDGHMKAALIRIEK